jgi:hypothetical protein
MSRRSQRLLAENLSDTQVGLSSYTPSGVEASGSMVLSSLLIMAGLGIGGFFGLHAYVHRDDPRPSVNALPAASPVPESAILQPQLLSAGLAAIPSAEAPAVAPVDPVSTPPVSKTSRSGVVTATADKPAASESASDNPY